MDLSIINKKCMATVICVVLSLWQLPVGLCVVTGLVTPFLLLTRRSKRTQVLKTGTGTMSGSDLATMLSAIMRGGVPTPAAGPPRPSKPAKKPVSSRQDPFA